MRIRRQYLSCIILFLLWLPGSGLASSQDLSALKKDQKVGDLQVVNLFSDSEGQIVGAKFVHIPTGAPVFLLQLEGVPQVLTWNDTPVDSNRGLAHSLEHLLLTKGTKGRYFTLLGGMRLSQASALTYRDSVYFGLASGAGRDGFFELFHALLDTLYRPDFSDAEAEREFYHFAVSGGQQGKKTLIEGGTVYNEMLASQDLYTYYYEINKRAFGEHSPFAFESGGRPEEMRGVTPDEIRHFHDKWYRIGPTTGFIFSFPPQGKVSDALERISRDLKQFSQPGPRPTSTVADRPKYEMHPSERFDPGIYPFPGANEAASGTIQIAWKPAKVDSLLDLKLLELFCHGLAGGENSLLQKVIVDSKTRSNDIGATGTDCYFLPESEPRFPVPSVEIDGVPGDRITAESLEQVRRLIVNTIREVSQYPDQSASLSDFNRRIASTAASMRRSNNVWTKRAPGFESFPTKTEWKVYFDRLEMDPSFVRSLSQERVWQAVDSQLASGKNIWRDLIQKLHLLDTPYITAGTPSRKLLEQIENLRQDRTRKKASQLIQRYGASDEQEAIARFEREEQVKSEEIDKIEMRVSRPGFTDHPPMVPDENIRYKQFEIEGVPVIASFFDRPATIDIGLSFDLRRIPSRYYKYLPLLPECLSSLGLKKGGQVVSYVDFSNKVQERVYAFSTGYESSAASKRADFSIRASATTVQEFRGALDLIRDAMEFNYLDQLNAGRLRDILARRVSDDESDARQDVSALSSAYSFFYQNDRLFVGLHSRFTTTHWDERLRWLLHEPLNSGDIQRLSSFATNVVPPSVCASRQELLQNLNVLDVKGTERELVDYWKRNLYSFPEAELCDGLQRLTREVQEDLTRGPANAIRDLKELQRIILNREALHLDLTLSEPILREVQPDLAGFLKSVPALSVEKESDPDVSVSPIRANVERRYNVSLEHRPLYLGFMNPDLAGSDVAFYAHFPDYSQTDHKTLVRVAASHLFGGNGPDSFFTKTRATGLAYQNYIGSDLGLKLMWYHADKSPDVPSLVRLVNSIAYNAPKLPNSSLVDYVMALMFSFSREMSDTSGRGKAMAHDLRDGNEPERIRRFSGAILKLRQEPDLPRALIDASLTSICGVLLRDDCKKEQEAEQSLFFFVGSEQVLSNAEKQIPVPGLLRLYASDFWVK